MQYQIQSNHLPILIIHNKIKNINRLLLKIKKAYVKSGTEKSRTAYAEIFNLQCSDLFQIGNAVGMSSEINMLPFHTFEPKLQSEKLCQNLVFLCR